MNAKRVNAAAGVILAAQKQRETAAGIAAALEAAGVLQSPESAAELVALRERVAELEAEAYGDATVRLVDPISQIRHLHACVAAQRSRADVLDRLCGKYQERSELLEGSPWERAVAGLNALVDADVVFHVEPDGHISAPFSDEHIEWDRKAKRWVLTHDEDEDVPPLSAVSAEDAARAAADPCHPCGCPKRFNRHADGCPALPEVTPAPAAKCRCGEPGADPYECEADDCTAEFSELNPFGAGARPVNVASAEVSRKCDTCGWTTSVWHVDDGSADQELHEHIARAHSKAVTS